MHQWDVSPTNAIQLQNQLAEKISIVPLQSEVETLAGIDLAYDKKSGMGFCCIVVFSYPELKIKNIIAHHQKVTYPYVPGLLTFREGPLIEECWKKMKTKPGLLMFDGQGIAHPRCLGIAAHMGVFFDIPAIGCAKSKLYGDFEMPKIEKGSKEIIWNKSRQKIGYIVRTRTKVKPVFVSPGHRIDCEQAADMILNCTSKYRLPEPTRIADIEVAKYKKWVVEKN